MIQDPEQAMQTFFYLFNNYVFFLGNVIVFES